MTRSVLIRVSTIVCLLVLFLGSSMTLYPDQEFYVNIKVPSRNGMEVGKGMTVEGTANLQGGNYLWVLVHRIRGFEEYWWPQGEAKIDPVNHKWERDVVFGGPQDIGYDFGIAVIVVNEAEHSRLKNYRKKAMESGHWPPIEMPKTVVAPSLRTVKKVSHD